MKKALNIILRLLFSVAVIVTAYFTVEASIRVATNDTHAIIEKSLKKASSDQDKTEKVVEFADKLGLSDKLLQDIPKKYHYDLTYEGLNNLFTVYQENGELTAKNLNLPQKNKLEQVSNHYLLKQINDTLKQNKKAVKKTIKVFHYSLILLVVLALLSIILMLFNKYWASLFLLLASVGSYVILNSLANSTINQLKQFGGTWSMTVSPVLTGCLIAGIALTLIWPLGVKLTKE